MLTEDELQQLMHGGVASLLRELHPRPDLKARLQAQQQRRTTAVAIAAIVSVAVAAITSFAARSVLNSRDESRVGTPDVSSTARPNPQGYLVTEGQCAGLAVTLSRPTQPPERLLRLLPSPAVNATTMNNNDLRYLQASGPCVAQLRMRASNILLQGASPDGDQRFYEGIAGVVSKGVLVGGTDIIKLFLDCTGPGCPGESTPVGLLTVTVLPGTAQPTMYPSPAPGEAPAQAGRTSASFGVNDRGETYGGADEIAANGGQPDLVGAIATNGKVGYVRSSDLNGRQNATREEVDAQLQLGTPFSNQLPVYDKDGVTVIGVVELGTPAQGNESGSP